MKRHILSLGVVLLTLTGCKQSSSHRVVSSKGSYKKSSKQLSTYDEELGAFVVKDDGNVFSASSAAQEFQVEELAIGNDRVGDSYADSAQYGLKPIYFEFNKYKIADLSPDQKPVLKENTKILQGLASKGYRVSVEGHACNSAGSTEYNMLLSEDRARAVKQEFEKSGVRTEIHYVGYGAEHRIVPTGDRDQQAPNRRVEVYAYKPDA